VPGDAGPTQPAEDVGPYRCSIGDSLPP